MPDQHEDSGLPLADQLMDRMTARIGVLNRETQEICPPESTEEAKEFLWNCLTCSAPSSNHLLLLALRWCLQQEIREVDCSYVLSTAVDILDVSDNWWVSRDTDTDIARGEEYRQSKQFGFDQWPAEDCALIRDWLEYVSTLSLQIPLDECLAKVLPYWRTRTGRD